MKKYLLFALFLLTTKICFSQQDYSLPPDAPLFTITRSPGWDSKYYEDHLMLEATSEDETVFYTVNELQTTELDSAIQEALKVLKYDFEDVFLGKQKEEVINEITTYRYGGLELNYESAYMQFEIRLFQIDGGNYFMIYTLGLPEDLEYYDFDLYDMTYSIMKI